MSMQKTSVQTPDNERDRFANRIDFYFAAVGSAVGFGNVWRFPALAYKYGGGAFFIPYIMALLIVGIPMLFLEIILGQFYQTGDIGVFSSFHRRLSGVGVTSIACGYILITYYSILIVWVINAFFASFSSSAPWKQDDVNTESATGYFFDTIVGMSTLDPDDQSPTRLVWTNVGYSALVWFIVWACTAFGLKLTGRITYFTMGFPILLLFIFLIKGATLEGAGLGVKEYIGRWDMSVLSNEPDIWSTAVSQIFFSLSVTFGVMTAYSSHMPRDSPALANTCIVAVCNSLFSFIAGFAVFAAIGHQAHLLDIPVVEMDNLGGFGLVFGTWPVVFSSFPGGDHWVRLLFLNLFLLGIDSAFSLLEGVVTCLMDSSLFVNTPKWAVSACVCIPGFLLSFIYATDAGLTFLDTIDYYLNFMLLIVGFFESFGLGWIYGIENQIEKFGLIPVLSHLVANFGAILFACGLWFGLEKNAIWVGFVAGVWFYISGMFITAYLLSKSPGGSGNMYDLVMGNMLDFKAKIEPVVGYVPYIWCILIKQIVPHILFILFFNLATSKNDEGKSVFGHYGSYDTKPYQVLGMLTFFFTVFLFFIGVVYPPIYDKLQPRNGIYKETGDDSFNENKDKSKEVGKGDEGNTGIA